MTTSALLKYDAARTALAEAHRIDEVKAIRDAWVAMEAYARQAKDETLIKHATEIRMRAERRAGELLIDLAKTGKRHTGRNNKNLRGSHTATPVEPPKQLSDFKVSKTQS